MDATLDIDELYGKVIRWRVCHSTEQGENPHRAPSDETVTEHSGSDAAAAMFVSRPFSRPLELNCDH